MIHDQVIMLLDWLIDTGCSTSIVALEVYGKKPEGVRPNLEEVSIDLQTANVT